jgi:hypothetical protein
MPRECSVHIHKETVTAQLLVSVYQVSCYIREGGGGGARISVVCLFTVGFKMSVFLCNIQAGPLKYTTSGI